MAEPIHGKVIRSLQVADTLYHRLVLLVGRISIGKTSAGRTEVLREVASVFDVPIINVNLVLSGQLLELTAKQRTLRTPGILKNIVNQAQAPILLDNLEILFDKHLEQNPLRLLQNISRNRAVVASWNGFTKLERLQYAEPGYPEYRSYEAVDALIVGMDGTATVDSSKISSETKQG